MTVSKNGFCLLIVLGLTILVPLMVMPHTAHPPVTNAVEGADHHVAGDQPRFKGRVTTMLAAMSVGAALILTGVVGVLFAKA